jgi:hypothetical protein
VSAAAIGRANRASFGGNILVERDVIVPRRPRTRRGAPRRPLGRLAPAFGAVVAAVVLLTSVSAGPSQAASTQISLSPTQANPGASVSVTGSGFDKKASGQLTFDGNAAGMPRFTASGAGTISVTFVVPGGATPGSHVIRAATTSASASATLTVVAAGPTPTPSPSPTPTPTPSPTATASGTVTLSPSQGMPGATVTASGVGFDRKASGSLTWDSSSTGMPPITTNGAGSFTTTFVVPASAAPGIHVVRAATSRASGSANFTVLVQPTPTPTPSPTPTPTPTPSPTATPTPDPNDIGVRGPTYPSTVTAPTGQKPQSKLWINDGIWWGALYNSAAFRFEIFRFDWPTEQWTPTGVAVDSRLTSSSDALWDGSHLFIVTHASDQSNSPNPPTGGDLAIRLLRYSYNAATRSYSVDSGYPVTVGNAAIEAAVITEDSTGVLWMTWTYDNGSGGRNVVMTHSAVDSAHWVTPYVLPATGAANATVDDISAVVSYNGKVGVMWSNQNDASMYFASHVDGASDVTWVENPAVQGPKYADDHISLRSLQSDPRGQIFAATKTSLDELYPGSSQPLILFLVLDTTGSWHRYTVGRVSDNQTRPIVEIDSENHQAYVFVTAPVAGGTVYYKSTSLSHPSFSTGVGTPFMQLGPATTSDLNNSTSTKQNVDSSTGLVVLASDDNARMYMTNVLTIAPFVQIAPTATDGSLTVTGGQTTNGTLSGGDTDGDPLTFSIVSGPSQGTVTITNPATGDFSYTPNTGVAGADSFTFKVNDGLTDSNVATESLTILPADGSRGVWLMDEGSGTMIVDGSGLGNNGTLSGTPTWVTGVNGNAIHFNGTTDYARVANSSTLNPTGSISLAAWIRPEKLATQYIIKKGNLGTTDGYELSLSASGTVFFRLDQASNLNTYRVDSISHYPTNGTTWMHVAATYDGTTMRVYINGVLEASVSGPAAIGANSQPLAIGTQSDGTAGFFGGAIDEAHVWGRTLSDAEIAALAGSVGP